MTLVTINKMVGRTAGLPAMMELLIHGVSNGKNGAAPRMCLCCGENIVNGQHYIVDEDKNEFCMNCITIDDLDPYVLGV
jgi:hypothetical protein